MQTSRRDNHNGRYQHGRHTRLPTLRNRPTPVLLAVVRLRLLPRLHLVEEDGNTPRNRWTKCTAVPVVLSPVRARRGTDSSRCRNSRVTETSSRRKSVRRPSCLHPVWPTSSSSRSSHSTPDSSNSQATAEGHSLDTLVNKQTEEEWTRWRTSSSR